MYESYTIVYILYQIVLRSCTMVLITGTIVPGRLVIIYIYFSSYIFTHIHVKGVYLELKTVTLHKYPPLIHVHTIKKRHYRYIYKVTTNIGYNIYYEKNSCLAGGTKTVYVSSYDFVRRTVYWKTIRRIII